MEEFGLVASDYEYFRTRGFEVVKDSRGKFYIQPAGAVTHAKILEAKATAIKCGFAFGMNEEILGYTKPTKDGDKHNQS